MNEKLEQFYADIRGKSVSVVGLGISNIPVIDFLLDAGAVVVGRDRKSAEQLGDLAATLAAKGVSLRLGADYLCDIAEDVVFKAPGIRPDVPELAAAQAHGCALTSEMEVFLALCPAKIFAVTGSDGKTTTTTLIYQMLSRRCEKDKEDGILSGGARSARVYVGGNIGKPLLPEIADITEHDYVVLELSSFQLQAIMTGGRDFRPWPDVACITNVTPNHLNWHTDMDEYTRAKAEIFANQARGGRLVLNYDNEITRRMAADAPGHVTVFSSCAEPTPGDGCDASVFVRDGMICFCADAEEEAFPILAVNDIFIPGKHNVEN